MTGIRASWNQRHRLGQIAQDRRSGITNPRHLAEALRLRGQLDIAAMAAAWRQLQERHPVLRSSFAPDNLTCRPRAARPAGVTILHANGALAGPARRCGRGEQTLQAFCHAPFDLGRGPLARLGLLPVSPTETLFGLAVEHLVSDGWSLRVLLRDLATLYAAEIGEVAPALPPIPVSFRRYVADQYAYLQSAPGARALARAAQRTREVGPVPALPIQGFSGRRVIRHDRTRALQFRVHGTLLAGLTGTARSADLTVLDLMHAGLHAGLHRLSGRDAVATVLSAAGREAPGTGQTVGWLSGTMVHVSRPGSHPGSEAYLPHFRRELAHTRADARVPWPGLIARSAPELLGRHSPHPYVTFNGSLTSIRHTLPVMDFPGLSSVPVPISESWHDPAIATFWNASADRVAVTIQYKADWYERADIERLWQAIAGALDGWCAHAA